MNYPDSFYKNPVNEIYIFLGHNLLFLSESSIYEIIKLIKMSSSSPMISIILYSTHFLIDSKLTAFKLTFFSKDGGHCHYFNSFSSLSLNLTFYDNSVPLKNAAHIILFICYIIPKIKLIFALILMRVSLTSFFTNLVVRIFLKF